MVEGGLSVDRGVRWCILWMMILLNESPSTSAFSILAPRHSMLPKSSVKHLRGHRTCCAFWNSLHEHNVHVDLCIHRCCKLGECTRPTLRMTSVSLDDNGRDEYDLSIMHDADEDFLSLLPPGIPDEFVVVKQYPVPLDGFDLSVSSVLSLEDAERLELLPHNVTVPAALILLDPQQYPSQSRARKACRKGTVLVHRGPLPIDMDSNNTKRSLAFSNKSQCLRGRVADRVYAGDVIGIQTRMGNGKYNALSHDKPPFDLEVVYQDDHFAIVNKPAGVVVYSHRGGGHGRMTVRSALPFALTAPKVGTFSIIRRPMAVHRLDRPTSGLLLIAKTKPAMVDLTRQFVERKVKKTYTAIVNGIPDEPAASSISSMEAYRMGMDVDPDSMHSWQLVDYALEEKHAVTAWRALRYSGSLKAKDETLTLVELKPKTGRYHQLRRHMAWVCQRPIVGDKEYDGGRDAIALRERGLFLCSNRVSFEHPYYNTDNGRTEWDALSKDEKFSSGVIHLSDKGVVMVHATIDLPEKFNHFLIHERERFLKYSVYKDGG